MKIDTAHILLAGSLLCFFQSGFAQNDTIAVVASSDAANATVNVTSTENSLNTGVAQLIPLEGGLKSIQNASIPDVLIMTRSTLLGSVAQWLEALMTVVCGGQIAPARAFFQCINHDAKFPSLWVAMGLNSTSIQVQTIQTTQIVGQNANVDANSLLTLLSSNVTQLNDLVTQVTAQLPDFCLNAPSLMGCVNPFLQACVTSGLKVDQFARNSAVGNASAEGNVNTTGQLQSSFDNATVSANNATVSANIATILEATQGSVVINSSDVEQDLAGNSTAAFSNETLPVSGLSNEINITHPNVTGQARELDMETLKLIQAQSAAPVSKAWFNANFPLSHSADDVAKFVRWGLEYLCQNQSEKLSMVASHVPCIFNAISTPSCSDQVLDLNQAQASQENVCKAATAYGFCYLSSINSACSSNDLTNVFTDLGLAYFGATDCAKNMTVAAQNTVNIPDAVNATVLA